MDESGGGNPLVAEPVDSTTWSTGLWLIEDIEQTAGGIGGGSWVDASIGAATVGLDTLGLVLDPLGSLVSMGAAWLMEHFQPLSEALDWLAGDPDQITAYAQTWGNIAAHTGDGGDDLAGAVEREAHRGPGSRRRRTGGTRESRSPRWKVSLKRRPASARPCWARQSWSRRSARSCVT